MISISARQSVAQDDKLAHVEPLLAERAVEITETDIANVVFKMKATVYTAPKAAGCCGVMREVLLQQGELQERVLCLEQIPKCRKILFD